MIAYFLPSSILRAHPSKSSNPAVASMPFEHDKGVFGSFLFVLVAGGFAYKFWIEPNQVGRRHGETLERSHPIRLPPADMQQRREDLQTMVDEDQD
jgi:hypothetical protein